jgi:HAD superfamily hydrolase (TIGR01509 family)
LGEEGVKHLIIFDFDGVVADSEPLSNAVLADMVTELGLPTGLHDSYDRYMGRRTADIAAVVAREIGRRLPDTFQADFQRRVFARLEAELQPVPGVATFISSFKHQAQAIASSSSPERLALCLKKIGLAEHFGANVFSATLVAHGKPDPDIFLLTATRMKAHPDQCIVIEDSVSGVRAGRAAGMTTIGLLAGSHVRPGDGDKLLAAGAQHVVRDYPEATALLHRLDVS